MFLAVTYFAKIIISKENGKLILCVVLAVFVSGEVAKKE